MRATSVGSICLSLVMLSLTPVASQAVPVVTCSISSDRFFLQLSDTEAIPRNYGAAQEFFCPAADAPWNGSVWVFGDPTVSLQFQWALVHFVPNTNFLWEGAVGEDFRATPVRPMTSSWTSISRPHHAGTFPDLGPVVHIDRGAAFLFYGIPRFPSIPPRLSYEFTLSGRVISVPEPSSLLFSAGALLGGAAWLRKRKTQVRIARNQPTPTAHLS